VWEVTLEEISKAYRKLARFCHPDKVSGMSDEEAARAERAYETLRLAKECLAKDDSRGPYVREHCQFLKPDTTALEIKSGESGSIDRLLPLSAPLLFCCQAVLAFVARLPFPHSSAHAQNAGVGGERMNGVNYQGEGGGKRAKEGDPINAYVGDQRTWQYCRAGNGEKT